MSTLIATANDLARSLLKTRNKKHATRHIIYEVNSLVYSESNYPLSYAAKTAIVQLIDAQPKDSRMFQQRKKIF